RQCDRKTRWHQRILARGKRQRFAVWNRGHEIEAGGLGGLIGRQRQALGVGQALQFDGDFRAQDAGSRDLPATLFTTCAISSVATCPLVIARQASAAISPLFW